MKYTLECTECFCETIIEKESELSDDELLCSTCLFGMIIESIEE
jgi:formylmethanofuran dehydrogenase subunit E